MGWIGNVVARTVLRKGMKKALKGANSLGGKKTGNRRKKGAREAA